MTRKLTRRQIVEAGIEDQAERLEPLVNEFLGICRQRSETRSEVLTALLILIGVESGAESAYPRHEFLELTQFVLRWAYDRGVQIAKEVRTEQ